MSRSLNLAQVAARAQVTPAAVSMWRRRFAATFPAPTADGRFLADEVDAWLATHRPKSTPRPPGERGAALTLLEPIRDLLDVQATRAVLLSLITLQHLGSGGAAGAEGSIQRARRLEDEGLVPRGALTIPLARAEGIPAGTWAQLERVTAGVLTTADAAAVFDDVLEGTVSAKFDLVRTSKQLADFLVALMPEKPRSILDPACGLGTVLIAATRAKGPQLVRGYEIQPETWALCWQRMTVNGLTGAEVLSADSFDAYEQGFEVVVVDPPFGVRFSDESPARARLIAQDITGASAGDFAWLLTARDALAAGGTALVLTAMGPTFASGPSQTARHELLRTGSVEAVIALPPGVVAGSAQPAAVWILRPKGTVGDVLLINAAPRRTEDDVLTLAAGHYQRWRRNPHDYQPAPGFSAVQPVLELLAGEVTMTPAKWTEVPIDPAAAIADASTKLAELHRVTQDLQHLALPDMHLSAGNTPHLVSLADLERRGRVAIQRSRHISRDSLKPTGRHPVVTGITSEGSPRIAGYLDQLPDGTEPSEPGDVLLATLGQVRATVDRAGGHVLSSSMWQIRPLSPDPATAPDLLALLLSSPRIAEQQVGSTVQRLRHPKDVAVPLLPLDVAAPAAKWAENVAALRTAADELLVAVGESFTAVAAALDAGARGGPVATTPHHPRPGTEPPSSQTTDKRRSS